MVQKYKAIQDAVSYLVALPYGMGTVCWLVLLPVGIALWILRYVLWPFFRVLLAMIVIACAILWNVFVLACAIFTVTATIVMKVASSADRN